MLAMPLIPVITLAFIALIVHPSAIYGFNIDVQTVNAIQGMKGSLFGFSSSFLPAQPNNNGLRMLVGAPNANVTRTGQSTGMLYLCGNVLDPKENCSEEKYLDDRVPMRDGPYFEEYGSTVSVLESGTYAVCGPNWKDTDEQSKYITYMPGRCAIAQINEEDIYESLMPFFHRDAKKNYFTANGAEYFHGLASFGFSSDSDKKSVFVFGAPGVLTSEGTVVIKDVSTDHLNVSQSSSDSIAAHTSYGYLGYSVKVGRFCDGSDVCFAASAPNLNRVGMVIIYRWLGRQNLIPIQRFTTTQAWTYFGYSMCTVDIDGDGYDELLVGAPNYSDLDEKPVGYDQGRVFIYSRSKTNVQLHHSGELDGSRGVFARFGSAIQHIGDINLDTYADVAVGAPGEDDGEGSIYIYLGSFEGLFKSPSQRITSKQVSKYLLKPFKGFGFSFSDQAIPPQQKYPVFATSSVVNDTIFVFKSRPVVDVVARLTANPKLVDMEKGCSVAGVSGVCFKFALCMQYTLRGGGSPPLTFLISLDMDVQVQSQQKRAKIRLNNTLIVESVSGIKMLINTRNNTGCMEFVAVLNEENVNRDRFAPVQMTAKYSLEEDPSADIRPLLDILKPNNVSETVTFLNKCGDDSVCEVDLSVQLGLHHSPQGNLPNIVVNSTKELLVNVTIKNTLETSYWTVIELQIDSPLKYRLNVPLYCQQILPDTGNDRRDKTAIFCNYHRPLDKGASYNFHVIFDTTFIEVTKKTLQITANVSCANTNGKEVYEQDNIMSKATDVNIIAEATMAGSSDPSEIYVYEVKQIPLKDSGSHDAFRPTGNDIEPVNVTHKILVTNNGPSYLPNTTISIRVPVYLLDRTQLVTEADVKVATADGTVLFCNASIWPGFIQQVTSSTSELFTESTESTTSVVPEDTTQSRPPVNRRRKRSSDKNGEEKNTIYTLDCNLDVSICAVFNCYTGDIQPGKHAEITLSLIVDKANIPLPEKYNAFNFTIQANLSQPTHPLFIRWKEPKSVKTVTQFYLVQSGGQVNIWIIIGSVIAGLVLITIIVLIFWKLGFFKRDKHLEVEQWKRQSQRKSRQGYSKAPNEDAGEGASAAATE